MFPNILLFVILLVALIGAASPVLVVYYLYRKWVFDQAMRDSNKYVMCPKCHRMVQLQWFLCDRCGQLNKLIPTEKNIHFVACTNCGKELPTSNRDERHLLNAVCSMPDCGNFLGPLPGVNREIIIPIVGGPSTGKTTFMDAWLVSACLELAITYKISFPFLENQQLAKQCIQNWQKGLKPNKTAIATPACVGIDIVPQDSNTGWRVYMYDPAGEFFDSSKNLLNFSYYDYMDGIIFLVDPFSIRPIFMKYHSQLQQAEGLGFQVGSRDMNNICDRLINSMQNYHNLKFTEYHYANCAVVITKADSFDLDQQIGKQGIERLMHANPSLDYLDAMHTLCYHFLENAGVGNVLAKLEDNFEEVRCFSISSFGHMPDTGQAYKPERVTLPIEWIVQNALPNQQ
ncbi:MAG: hypothetical protein Q4G59_09385 [Planctomycetia bacterium]|nr:hypothetical protein [Planctomycetia bacterium]